MDPAVAVVGGRYSVLGTSFATGYPLLQFVLCAGIKDSSLLLLLLLLPLLLLLLLFS